MFGIAPDPNEARTPDGMRRLLMDGLRDDSLPPHELAYFVERLMVFVTSSDERRFGQWEHVSWWDFIQAEDKSDEYKKVLARGLTRAVVAAKERKASTRTIGNMGEAFVYSIMERGNDGAPDRVLNLPTNEAWIDPWVKLLRGLGVRFHVGQAVEALQMQGGKVVSARARDRRGRRRTIEADWFVSAMPAERARKLWSPAVLRADESLELMNELYVDWMNGIQYYMKKPFHVIRGHLTFIDAPWALTALTQAQFWADRDFPRDYGDGTQLDSFSVDISDWDTPGIVYGKPAKQCTPKQVAKEVLEQIKLHLNDNGEDILTDDMIDSWHLDPAIKWHPARQRNSNDEPLLVNTVGTWEKRPTAKTEIPNLFLAGDYVQTDVDLATMEGANESGRAAVNALLEASGSKAEPVDDVQALRPARVRGREGRRPRAVQAGPAEPARQALELGHRQRVVLRALRPQRGAVERDLRRPERVERRRVRGQRRGALVALDARERHVRPERPLLGLVEARPPRARRRRPAEAVRRRRRDRPRSSAKRRARRGGTGITSPGTSSGASPVGGRAHRVRDRLDLLLRRGSRGTRA